MSIWPKIEKMGQVLGKNLNFKKVKKGSHAIFDPMPISEGRSKNSENLPDN
jgi:hypothetical protein